MAFASAVVERRLASILALNAAIFIEREPAWSTRGLDAGGPMDEQVYTHANWAVKPGEEDAFVAAWDGLADAFHALPAPPLWGTLIRSCADASTFCSFGAWRSAADVEAMRADPRAGAAMEEVRAHCREATPGLFELVRHARP